VPALGIALATAFAGIVAAESTIAGEQAAHSVLAQLSPLERSVRVTWQGPITATVQRSARSLLRGLGFGSPTEVVLLNPVRLGGVVVRPAAITPLRGWLANPAVNPGPCRARNCPMILVGRVGARSLPTSLAAPGVKVTIVGHGRLRSAAPLGFTGDAAGQQAPLLVTGDVTGLARVAALGAVYRTHQWLSLLPVAKLRSWQLAGVRRELGLAEATLLAHGSQFSFTAPFTGLDAARSQAGAAPGRLLLVGGGALAALALFVALAVGGLKRELVAELGRLESAGARSAQCAVFVIAESALLTGAAVAVGALAAVAAAALLASAAGEPVGGVLIHSLLTPAGAAALLGGWLCATVLVAVLLSVRDPRLADLAVAVAAVALVLSLALGSGANDSVSVLLAPLCCLTAGLVIFRAVTLLLPVAERSVRRGPVLARLSLVGLARAPGPPALAIAFVAVATGLGGFALGYRATLLRGDADEAADSVPLDAIVSPGSDFATPLSVAPLARWRSIANAQAWPVRRTDASFTAGAGTLTVTALGIPASAVARLRGWRASDGSALLAALARKLVPPGPSRVPGPLIPAEANVLSLRIPAAAIAVTVTADLRAADGRITHVPLGEALAGARPQTLSVRLPRAVGPLELEALELTEPAGLQATNGHQDAESPAATTQASGSVELGPLMYGNRPSRPVAAEIGIGRWTAVGAAGPSTGSGPELRIRFSDSGQPGIVRPRQPSDTRPVPVLVDPLTAAAAGRAGRLALTVDGLPIAARVVGLANRFPTVAAAAAGFVVADERTLAGALDAALPGQGRADELWFGGGDLSRLRTALRGGAFVQLSSAFRTDVERRLRGAPVARAVLATLIAAAAVSGALAIVGLLVALLGAGRDRSVERDLVEQGIGPRDLRRELALRVTIAAAAGVAAGLALAVVLTRLAVAAVRAAGTLATPRPPLVTVVPWGELLAWGVGSLAALVAAAALGAQTLRRRAAA
jgi:hypothetical protein